MAGGGVDRNDVGEPLMLKLDCSEYACSAVSADFIWTSPPPLVASSV
jgi:hypothetical protein